MGPKGNSRGVWQELDGAAERESACFGRLSNGLQQNEKFVLLDLSDVVRKIGESVFVGFRLGHCHYMPVPQARS
jgi:hypothetical protein